MYVCLYVYTPADLDGFCAIRNLRARARAIDLIKRGSALHEDADESSLLCSFIARTR